MYQARVVPQPDVPPAEAQLAAACNLCDASPATTVLLVGTQTGDVLAYPAQMSVCAVCQKLIEQGDDTALAKRLSPDFDDFGRDVAVQTLRRNLT